MTRVFADTFYYLALLNPVDEAHKQAVEFTSGFAGRIVTTHWVLTELADALSPLRTRSEATRFIDSLRADSAVRVARAGRAVLERGWNLYRR